MAWARQLRRAYDGARAGADPPAIVRQVINTSWARCRQAGVDPERHVVPVAGDRDDIAERWRAHPLSRYVALVEQLLCDYAFDARHIVVIADADELQADVLLVGAMLDEGRLRRALRLYAGPLLPASRAPGIVRAREALAGRVRAATDAAARA